MGVDVKLLIKLIKKLTNNIVNLKKIIITAKLKKAKGNYESDLDRFNATLRKNTNIDLNKVNKYQVDRGKKAVAAAMIAHDKYKK